MTKQQLIEDNMSLVYSFITKKYPTFINDDDIIQCGMVGLCKAAEKWDKNKGNFSTFAWYCIRNEICREFKRRMKYRDVLSLDYEMEIGFGEKCSFGELLVGEDDVAIVEVDNRLLTARQSQILKLAKSGMTYSEIARQLGISTQRVSAVMRKIRKVSG